jgi:predicted metal-dependent HD superfamily phosphohydrolase
MELRERWPLPDRGGLRDALLAAYRDPRRGYHDLRHLTEVLDRLDELGCDDPVVVLAAWFHDAVYEGGADDEERSARWAEQALDPPGSHEVARLVRMTATHRPDEHDHGAQVLSDADLAILAAPAERYAEYVSDVRREYGHVSDAEFARGRAAVLGDLLAKPTLFHTELGRVLWEVRARENVSAELTRLGA